LLGLLLRLLLGLLRGCAFDELDGAHRGAVAAAGTELDDARVATRTILEALAEIDEHLLDQVHALLRAALLRLGDEGREVRSELALDREAPDARLLIELVVRGVGGLAETPRLGDDLLRDAADFLRFRVGRLDALVEHEVRRERAERRLPVRRVAVELTA